LDEVRVAVSGTKSSFHNDLFIRGKAANASNGSI
jgi:hypothetical protein